MTYKTKKNYIILFVAMFVFAAAFLGIFWSFSATEANAATETTNLVYCKLENGTLTNSSSSSGGTAVDISTPIAGEHPFDAYKTATKVMINENVAAGTYTANTPPFAVTIGTATPAYYDTIEKAFAAANNATEAATIKMTDDAGIGTTLEVAAGKDITLDLNGCKLSYTGTNSAPVITVTGGKMTLEDSNPESTHTIANPWIDAPEDKKQVTIKGGVITGGTDSGLFVKENGTFIMNGGNISGNTTMDGGSGGGLFLRSSTAYLYGGTISHNYAKLYGGGMRIEGSKLYIGTKDEASSLKIIDNIAENSAGGIDEKRASESTIYINMTDEGEISRNQALAGDSGGMCVEQRTNLTIKKAKFLNNSAAKYGGGMVVYSTEVDSIKHTATIENVNIEDVVISGNTAGSSGGGVYIYNDNGVLGKFIMNGGSVTGNKAPQGAGVYVGGIFEMNGGSITGNAASTHGGGVYSNGTFNVSNIVTISGNKKGDSNNNVYLSSGKITVDGTLSTGAKIGVVNTGEIATGYNQDNNPSVYFLPDDPANNCVYVTNGTVKIGTHTEETVSKVAATCTTTGLTEGKKCSGCKAVLEAQTEINALGHDEQSHTAQTATCTEKGWNLYVTCSRCDYTTKTEINALGHDEQSHAAQAATCTEKGWVAYNTCSRCDHTTYSEIAALGHSSSIEFTVDLEPTCTEKGSKSKYCARCDEKTEVTEIDFAAHTLTHVAKKDATTTEVGNIEYWTCSVCRKKFSDNGGASEIADVVIPMLKAELVKPDENSGENQVVVTTDGGFTPDIELVVTEIEQDNDAVYETIAQTVNGEINIVYDVMLKSDGESIQPDGTLTIKMRIPQNLVGKNFNIFHLHEDTATDMEYTVEGNYAVVSTDRLSEFIFVGEKTAVAPAHENSPVDPLWLTLIVVVSLVIVGEVGFIVYRKVRKNKAAEGKE